MRWDNDIYRSKFGFKIQHGLELAAQVKPVRGKLLELGSETGILSYQLWKLEYQVEGIEFDSRLVDMARRTTAKSVFFEAVGYLHFHFAVVHFLHFRPKLMMQHP